MSEVPCWTLYRATRVGERPILGRTWTEAEDRALARVTVISLALWRRFAGEATVLGRTITIDREPHEIIGVMGRDFSPDYIFAANLWTPLGIHEGNLPNPRSTFLLTVARLRPGSTLTQLDVEVRAALAAAAAVSPDTHKGWTGGAMSMREFQFGRGRPALVVLLAAVVVLALVAVANLANVILAQVMSRRSELALRAALGGSVRDVIRLQIVECLILAAAGIVCWLLASQTALTLILLAAGSVLLGGVARTAAINPGFDGLRGDGLAGRALGRVWNLTGADTALVGIDFRVQDGKLCGVGNGGGVYTVDTTTAEAAWRWRTGRSPRSSWMAHRVLPDPPADGPRDPARHLRRHRRRCRDPAGPVVVGGPGAWGLQAPGPRPQAPSPKPYGVRCRSM